MTTERKHWRLPRLMITGLAQLAGIAALSFQMQPRATAEPPSGQWLAVQPSNLEHRIGLVGRIERLSPGAGQDEVVLALEGGGHWVGFAPHPFHGGVGDAAVASVLPAALVIGLAA